MITKTNALLVKFSTSQWAGERFDKKVTEEVDKLHQAKDAGRYNKKLLAKEALEKGKKARNDARTFVYIQTLPWTDEGWRVLTSANYMPFTQAIRSKIQAIKAADQEFFGKYLDYVNDAKARLNSLFNQKDYPALADLGEKFDVKVDFTPIPESSDIRTEGLDQADLDAIGADIDDRVRTATEGIVKDLWSRLFEPVKHMTEKLSDPKAIFRDSLINNLKDICDLLPRLNITNDKDLEKMSQTIRDSLTKYTPDDLRPKDTDKPQEKKAKEHTRKEAAAEAQKILDSFSAYFTPQGKEEANHD